MKIRRTHAQRCRSGLTLIELLVVVTILTVALGELVQSLLSVSRLGPANLESAIALEAVQSQIEAAKGMEFSEIVASYNGDGSDDPDGAGTAVGTGFSITGFDAVPGDADGLVGRIELPLSGGLLREDLILPELGLPRDLNADGVIDSLDHSADCVLIPMRVSIDWQSRNGPRTVTLTTILVPFMDPDATAAAGFVDPALGMGATP